MRVVPVCIATGAVSTMRRVVWGREGDEEEQRRCTHERRKSRRKSDVGATKSASVSSLPRPGSFFAGCHLLPLPERSEQARKARQVPASLPPPLLLPFTSRLPQSFSHPPTARSSPHMTSHGGGDDAQHAGMELVRGAGGDALRVTLKPGQRVRAESDAAARMSSSSTSRRISSNNV